MTQPKRLPRYRFAPSPTGHLHIGGARTALFNWLLARQTGGQFVLRIEDTDRERSTPEFEYSILRSLEWLELDWDEEPQKQSGRDEIYRSYVRKLIDEGRAYKCFCTREELDEMRKKLQAEGKKPKYDGHCRQAPQNQQKPYCVRFKSPDEGTTIVNDLIKGPVSFNHSELDDLVLQRTDGSPTYNFVVVIDDALMGITHIIRGDDHLNNTPRQIQLYEALGFPIPEFGHLPLILGQDKARLSKRHGATSVLFYKEAGYLPQALLNFLARIGWSHGNEEIFSREDLVQKFSLKNVGKSGGIFNAEKLLWLNSHYIKQSSPQTLHTLSREFFRNIQLPPPEDPGFLKAIEASKQKSKTLPDLAQSLHYFVTDDFVMETGAQEQFLTDSSKKALAELLPLLENTDPFTGENLHAVFTSFLEEKNLKMKEVAQPLRVALTGGTTSPGIHELLDLLGKERVLKRIRKVLC